MQNFSDYIVFADESGDHGLKNIDPKYPVFVLVFCIFAKRSYVRELVPAIQELKFRHFGHDQAILHETDIRKDRGDFAFLKDRERKAQFMHELTVQIKAAPLKLVAVVIDKKKLRSKYPDPRSPYDLALGYGLEQIQAWLEKQDARGTTHVVVERRGAKEDRELELEFRRVRDGGNRRKEVLPFEIVFADKKSNSAGLQLADLTARPIGMHVLRPRQSNRAFEAIRPKLVCNAAGKFEGAGLQRFP